MRVLVGQQRIIEWTLFALCNFVIGICHVSERNGPRRARRLTCRNHFADWLIVAIGGNPRLRDPLYAKSAFLHHAARANGHFRVSRFRRSLFLLGEREIIEAAHLVGAIVGTKPRANAPVVDHDVEALGIMHRRADGANDFAGSLLAMHAQHGLKIAFWSFGRSRVVAVNSQPLHLAFVNDLLFAHDRNVVFSLARDDACVAADACVQIDAHRPCRWSFWLPAIQRALRLRSGEKLGVFEVIRERSMPDNFIRLGKNQVVMLGARQFRAPGQLF